MTNRHEGGSSTWKETLYKQHYLRLNMKRLKKAKRELIRLQEKFPDKKYELDEITTPSRGHEIKKYKVRRIK